MKTPERSTAAAFPRYLSGEVLADSAALQWPGLFARHFRLPRVVDRLLVPATLEPHISCNLRGTAEFRERDAGRAWVTRQIRGRDLFVTRSRTPYEVGFHSPPGENLETLSLHVAVEPFLAAVNARFPGQADRVQVADFFGHDETLWHICRTCSEMLAARTPGKSPAVAALTQLFAAHLVERYANIGAKAPAFRGGLPIRQLRKVEDYIAGNLAEEISIDQLAGLVEQSPSHFAHVFKETTGMTPLQFVTRERITRAQQMIRECPARKRTSSKRGAHTPHPPERRSSRSLIEIGLEIGYSSPSHFAQVFRRVVGVTPSQFRSAL